MKKIIITLAIAASFVACKKDDPKPTAQPAPVKTTTTTATDPKWTYRYNYNKAGDNLTYQSEECLTPDEMAVKKQLINAFNVQQFGRCN